MARDRKQEIDDTFFTAYNAAGYGIDIGTLSTQTRKRIERTLSDLTDAERSAVLSKTQYVKRIRRLETLASFSPQEIVDIIQRAKKNHISPEEQYRRLSDASRS